MATITWLADQLKKDTYISVIEQSGWKTRMRSGSFSPVGVLLHHTGSTASNSNPAPSLNTVLSGRSDLPGPLCHVLVDYKGKCRVIAGGRANHAGEAKASGPISAGDGNTKYIGIEIDYSGSQNPSDVQYAAVVDVAAAILARLGKTSTSCRCHKETSVTGKWDPGHTFTPAEWRSMISAWQSHYWSGSNPRGRTARTGNSSSLDLLRAEILTNGPANLVSKGFLTEAQWAAAAD